MPRDQTRRNVVTPPLYVKFRGPDGRERVRSFTDPFHIGREASCSVRVLEETVSRHHAEVYFDGNNWWVRDLNSANGTTLDGEPIDQALIEGPVRLCLGSEEALVVMDLTEIPLPPAGGTLTGQQHHTASMTQVRRRYLDESYNGEMGEHTQMVRRAIKQASRKQSNKYRVLIGMTVVLLLGAVGFGVYQYTQIDHIRELTVKLFYNMKSLDLQIAQIESLVQETGDTQLLDELSAKRQELQKMSDDYDEFLRKTGILEGDLSEQDKVIYRMARVFGECEVNLPPGFISEVKRYIGEWQSSDRLANALQRATENGYTPIIYEEMLRQHLPPQFLYLALQESNFNQWVVGPSTRYGFAKGMWQFIPATARRYGLRTGPLVELPHYDPRDERFHFDKATRAAARYLKYIYTTEAQASGLLVMASYNWGEHRIRRLLAQMPSNPRERNFWELIKRYKIPQETYDYVYYIFSAAVIGENPRLFGFDFDNPLAELSKTRLDSDRAGAGDVGAGGFDDSESSEFQ